MFIFSVFVFRLCSLWYHSFPPTIHSKIISNQQETKKVSILRYLQYTCLRINYALHASTPATSTMCRSSCFCGLANQPSIWMLLNFEDESSHKCILPNIYHISVRMMSTFFHLFVSNNFEINGIINLNLDIIPFYL